MGAAPNHLQLIILNGKNNGVGLYIYIYIIDLNIHTQSDPYFRKVPFNHTSAPRSDPEGHQIPAHKNCLLMQLSMDPLVQETWNQGTICTISTIMHEGNIMNESKAI